MTVKELEKLLSEMSLEEKVGQMVQRVASEMVSGAIVTGPEGIVEPKKMSLGLIGSILNTRGAATIHDLQKEFIEKHPHHIPLLTMYDVINGMETIFPIPLAQGCTFSPETVEDCAAMARDEAAAEGLHVNFSPMLDLVRDPRWGRVMESTGEDPWLNAQLGKAMVRGYQKKGNMAACLKHFAGYGAPEGGRDYENVELSERTFREDYLPAYAAAVKEGCAMVMTSFNSWNRIPSTGNRWLMRKVLRQEMGFDGVLISDFAAIDELIRHGIAEDSREAAKLAIEAGVDIDMQSNAYMNNLVDLVRSGEVDEKLVDEAVMRILKLKNDLGLFENPYNGSPEDEKRLLLCEEHRKKVRVAAASSFVLLKNEGLLPLKKEEKVAFIGPYADNCNIHGSWTYLEHPENNVTIKQGVERKIGTCTYAKGAYVLDEGQKTRMYDPEERAVLEEELLREAVELAKTADKVVLCLGEHRHQTGEGGSRASITLSKGQLRLMQQVAEVNKNIVTVVFSGRPVELGQVQAQSQSILMAWMPGTEGGNALADVLYGDAVPQGKLSMTIPRSVGQVPIYYNCFNTGRPNPTGDRVGFIHGYIDESTKPLYPFGYGLSYTTFDYSPVTLSKTRMGKRETLEATATVKNTGSYGATETVQMYLQDVKGSVIRPLKMLRGVQKVFLRPGQSREVSFQITEDMLRFYNADMIYTSEQGMFRVYIGGSSDTENAATFTLE
ncbi:MAG: beta-glucosidase BglX [Ruminococcaceae bacterium]|nr:beta-glucosidase BglX [Oscillospiraceae bacterium]